MFEVWEINANGINSQTPKLQTALARVLDKLERILFLTQKTRNNTLAWLCRLAGLYGEDWTTPNTNFDLILFLDKYPVQEKLISSLGCRSRIAQVFAECKRSRWSQSVTFSSGNFGEMFELPHRGIFLLHWSLEKREKSWRLQKILPFDVILKEKEELLHFNWILVRFAESWTRNNFVFQKLLDYESISGQSICFLCEATKILTDNENETFLDKMIWFWDPDFLRLICSC